MNIFHSLKKLFYNSNLQAALWYFFSNLFIKALAFITIPLFTNLLSTAEYGYLNAYNAWIGIIGSFIGISLNSALRSIQKDRQYEKKEFQSSTLFLSFLTFLIITAITLIVTYFLKFSMVPVLFMLLQAYASFIISFISQEFMIELRYKLFAFVNVVPYLIAIIITVEFIKFFPSNNRQWGVILPRVLILTMLATSIFLYIIFRGKKIIDIQMWKLAICYCVPLVFHTLSLSILNQADRLMITAMIGLDETGIYGFTHNIALAMSVINAALDNVWISRFTTAMNEKEKEEKVNQKANTFINIYTLFVIGFIFVSPELIRIMANEAYWSGISYIAPFSLAVYVNFLYTFPVNHEYYEKSTKIMAWSSICAAFINIFLNYLIIPIWGGVGAACTTLVTYILLFFIHWRKSKKINKNLFPFSIYKQSILTVIFMTLLFYILINLSLIRWIIITIFTLFYLYFVIYRNIVQKL